MAAQSEAALMGVERAMFWALDQAVTRLIDPPLQPILNANSAYYSSLIADYDASYSTVQSGGKVTPAQATSFWGAASGADFSFAIALGIAITVAIVLLTSLSLGVGFLIGLAIHLAIAAGLAVLSWATSVVSLLDSPTTGSALVRTVWGLTNSTGDAFLSSLSVARITWEEIFGLLSAETGIGLLIASIAAAGVLGSFYWHGLAAVEALALAFLSLFGYLDYRLGSNSSPALLIWSELLGVLAEGVGLIGPTQAEGLALGADLRAAAAGGASVVLVFEAG